MVEYNESDIISQICAGDTGAFCELVEKYKHKALKIAYSFCANYEDAKDLSQEAFIKAFRKIKDFKSNSRFYTWFYRILVNTCKDYLRSKKRSKIMSFSTRLRFRDGVKEEEDIFESVASCAAGPKETLLNKELKEQLTGAISSLPEKQRIVFTLKNIHGLSVVEIAEITKCARGTIKAHLFKATANLRTRLEDYIKVGIPGGVR